MTGPAGGSGSGSAPVSAVVNVTLHGATDNAKAEFATAVQAYGEALATECERQEISNRPPGIAHPEITANSVVRAKQVFSQYGERSKPGALDMCALAGVPIFSGGAGVMGSYLNSTLQILAFAAIAFMGILSVFYLLRRRLL